MKRYSIICTLLLAVGLSLSANAADKDLAEGFADAGVKQLAQGKADAARQQFYKALGYDSNCAVALHEVAKLLEAEGNTAAASEFYAKAVVELAKDDKSSTRKAHAQKRLVALNPGAMALTSELESYAAELGRIANKSNDSITAEDAHARVDSLKLATLISADKMPKLPAAIAKTSERRDDGMLERDPKTGQWVEKKTSVANKIAPDVERALKAAGWTKIEGTWKKVAENVYEVTDGRLEAPITDGMLRVVVHRDNNDGVVKAMVRTKTGGKRSFFSGDDLDSWSMEGYGAIFQGGKAGMYGSSNSGFIGSETRPYKERTVEFPQGNKKNDVLIKVMGGKDLTITFCGKAFNNSERIFNYPLEREGPFVVEVKGTATIESPQCARQ